MTVELIDRLEFDPAASAIQAEAVDLSANRGSHGAALERLTQVSEALQARHRDTGSVSVEVQNIGVRRDMHMVHLRQAIRDARRDEARQLALNPAQSDAIDLDNIFVSYALGEDARAQFEAERGAAWMVAARIATACAVLEGVESEHLYSKSSAYHRSAHTHLVRANNRYYESVNAASAAVNTRLSGEHGGIGRHWLEVAASSAVRAATTDRVNFVPAVGAIIHRLPGLTSRRAAVRSVMRRP